MRSPLKPRWRLAFTLIELLVVIAIIAILAALHIADEFYQLKNVQAQNDAQLAARSSECAEMLDRILKHRDIPQELQTDY